MRNRDRQVKLALGSISKTKLRYLKEVLEELGVKVKISIHQVESGVGKQPMSRQETIKGAKNRAREALKRDGEAQIGIGMEGGLMEEGGVIKMVCVVAMADGKGNISWAESDKVLLPEKVAKKVEVGEQFGKVVREYSKKEDSKRVKELVTREKSFKQALRKAWKKFIGSG